jgi:signal transduction histidine kinase
VSLDVRRAHSSGGETEGEPNQIVVEVTNTGDGIPADLASRVFDPWVSSRDASIAGGLGLWLARETARDVGGNVTLTETGPGTCTFRISLPLARPGPDGRMESSST